MSVKLLYRLLRVVHFVGALFIGTALYAPLDAIPWFETLVKWIVLPVMAISGLVMWQLPRVNRVVGRLKTDG